jgi:hypothetical protein
MIASGIRKTARIRKDEKENPVSLAYVYIYEGMGDLLQRKVTTSVRKAIRALRERASQLEDERLQLADEKQFIQDALERVRGEILGKQPIAEEILKPVAELNSRATLNFLEIKELKRSSRDLQRRIQLLEEELGRATPSIPDCETSATRAEQIVRDYQALFDYLATPPPLPFPHSSHFLAKSAVINLDDPELKDIHRAACSEMANIHCQFNDLPIPEKRRVMQLLKDLKSYALEIILEIRKIDTEVEDRFRHDALVKSAIGRYTIIRLAMQKPRFLERT